MNSAELCRLYADLQRYVGWSAEHAQRVAGAAHLVRPRIGEMLDDFYAEILRHPAAAAVITGGEEQVARLKRTLHGWIEELLTGPYDETYVHRRARVGMKHVEIGLAQVYANVALARLRLGILTAVQDGWSGAPADCVATINSLNLLLDLDLSIITAVYEAEYVRREQATIRLQLESVVHQQREFSEGLLAYAPAIVVVLDLRFCVVRVNRYFEQLVGHGTAELEGLDFAATCVPDGDRARIRQALGERPLRRAAGGETQLPGEVESVDSGRDQSPALGEATSQLVTARGTRRSVRWSSTLLRDAENKPFVLLVLGQDITDLQAAQERALRSERLAAIGQMATGLAHEARNALQRIQASAEMLEREVQHLPTALGYVQRIEQAQSHMHQLFEEVRTYAAPVQLDRSECRVAGLWREAWDLLTPQRAGRRAVLRERMGADHCQTAVDRFRLVQVFRNILENALAACEDPVEIDIQCESAELVGRPALRVRVHDNGPGISAEHRARICEPFYTTKPTGTGLGLAIVQRLVEAHGGTLEIGTPQSGAEILVTLPLAGT
jgi:signal transduction histidine kinase